jgi:hypothetical protein
MVGGKGGRGLRLKGYFLTTSCAGWFTRERYSMVRITRPERGGGGECGGGVVAGGGQVFLHNLLAQVKQKVHWGDATLGARTGSLAGWPGGEGHAGAAKDMDAPSRKVAEQVLCCCACVDRSSELEPGSRSAVVTCPSAPFSISELA